MRTKDGVSLDRLRPEICQLFPIVESVYWAFNKVPIITSTNDSIHSKHSLHYEDLAFDLRVRHLGSTADQKTCWSALKAEINRLYPGWYDVLFESADTPNAHIHCEPSPLLLGLIEGGTREEASA